MATLATTPEVAEATPKTNKKAQTLDYHVIQTDKEIEVKDKDGNVTYKGPARRAITGAKEVAKAKAEGKYLFSQTLGFDFATELSAATEIIPDEKQAVKIWNNGLKSSRINPRAKRLLEDPSFNAVDGVFDIRELLREKPEREVLSQTDKAIKVLRGLPMFADKTEDELRAILGIAASSADTEDEDEELEDEEGEEGDEPEASPEAPSAPAADAQQA